LSIPAGAPGRPRQPILYADQWWRQQRLIAFGVLAIGLVLTPMLIVQHALFVGYNITFALYIPAGLLLAGGSLYYKRRSFVEPGEDGLVISTLTSKVTIDYEKIRNVKVQPLSLAFQDARKRQVVPMVKALIDKPAFFVRVRGTDEELGEWRRRLGSRMFYEDMIALPVADPDAVVWGVKSHLPESTGQNQGGSRRGKRRR
jgi:hypothetical protein